MFTVCALFYGDYPELAQRLLASLGQPWWPSDTQFRLGINNVSKTTSDIVWRWARSATRAGRCTVFLGSEPYHKYPTMRQMFHDRSLRTQNVMWFDDDSWIDSEAPMDLFEQLEDKLKTHDVVGAPYKIGLQGNQRAWIEQQPWYNGKPPQRSVSFITGGFVALKTDIITKHDWPPANFDHNGGDVMLGQLCYQHGYRMGRFVNGLHINAAAGGGCSSAQRRGFSQKPIGVDCAPMAVDPGAGDSTSAQVVYDVKANRLFDILDGKDAT